MGILYADYFLFSMFDDDLDMTNSQIFSFITCYEEVLLNLVI